MTFRWLFLFGAMTLAFALACPTQARAQGGCPDPKPVIVQSLRPALPLYLGDMVTVVDQVRGKTRESSLSLPVLACIRDFYVVDYPDVGRILVRKTDVVTSDGRETLELADCPETASIGNPNAQKRGGNGASAPMCRRKQ